MAGNAVKGRTSGEGNDGELVIEGNDRSQLTLWALDDVGQVKPAERGLEREPSSAPTETNLHPPKAEGLWEQVFSLPNLRRAMQRVVSNGGSTGIDDIEAQQLQGHFDANWSPIRQQLDEGTYRPQPVRRVSIPKPDGTTLSLGGDRDGPPHPAGIAAGVDSRLRPALLNDELRFPAQRSAHMAVNAAKGFIKGAATGSWTSTSTRSLIGSTTMP